MTNETNRHGNGPDRDDGELSRLYRAAATERTPAHLDARVLAAARRGAKTRYWTATHWFRPLAWAATIGLCLAIVLELTVGPDQGADGLYVPPPASMPEQREPKSVPLDAAPRRDEPPAAAAEQLKTEMRSLDAPAATTAEESEAAPETRQSRDVGASSRLRAAPEVDRDAFAELAASPAAVEMNDGAIGACPPEVIAAPDRWLECIANLEAEGRAEEAEEERRRFELAYPDYAVD